MEAGDVLGRVASGSSRQVEIQKAKEEENLLQAAFPDLDFSEEVDEEEIEDDEIFYLWDTNATIFNLYKILRNYLVGELYSIDSAILLALIKDKYLPITDTLDKIPYIHSGYVSALLPTRGSTNGSNGEDSSD